MRYLASPACGVAAFAAWHLLGPAWAFAVLTCALTWVAITLPAVSGPAGEKARAVERRLNAIIPNIPEPQASPGGTTNTSYGMPGGTLVTSNQQSSGNNGGIDSNTSARTNYGDVGGADNGGNTSYRTNAGSCGAADNNGVTSGQIGGAAAHYHDMHHSHPGDNHNHSMAHSHPGDQHDHMMTHYHVSNADLQDMFNALRDNHTTLISTHNTLISRLESSGVLR